MKRPLPLLLILITTLLLTVGCTIPRVRDTRAMPTSSSAPTEVAQTAPAETIAPVASNLLTTTLTVEEVPEIVSYRMNFHLFAEAPNITATVQTEGAFVKQPPAEQITTTIEGFGEGIHQFETRGVDGARYNRDGEMWEQVPDWAIEGEDVLIGTPSFVDLEQQVEFLGMETVNDRSVLHYRGEIEQTPYDGPPSDVMFDRRRYEWMQFDIWIDETYNVVISYSEQGRITDPPETLTMTYDLTGLNSDIQIVAPETSP